MPLERASQNPVVAIPCRFDPDQRHQNKKRGQQFLSFCFGNTLRVRTRQVYLPSFVYLRKQILDEGSRLRETAIPDIYFMDGFTSVFFYDNILRGACGKFTCRRSSIHRLLNV